MNPMNSNGLRRRTALEPLALVALLLELVLGGAAVLGGAVLMFDPDGSYLGLSAAQLAGTPFTSYFFPGLILALILGSGAFAGAWLVFARHRQATRVVLLLGIGLMAWVVVDWVFIHDDPLLVFAAAIAMGLLLTGVAWQPVIVKRRW